MYECSERLPFPSSQQHDARAESSHVHLLTPMSHLPSPLPGEDGGVKLDPIRAFIEMLANLFFFFCGRSVPPSPHAPAFWITDRRKGFVVPRVVAYEKCDSEFPLWRAFLFLRLFPRFEEPTSLFGRCMWASVSISYALTLS